MQNWENLCWTTFQVGKSFQKCDLSNKNLTGQTRNSCHTYCSYDLWAHNPNVMKLNFCRNSPSDNTVGSHVWERVPGFKAMGCAADHWKVDPKRLREKWNLGPKRSNSVRIGSFSIPKDRFNVGGWKKSTPKRSCSISRMSKKGVKTVAHPYHPT